MPLEPGIRQDGSCGPMPFPAEGRHIGVKTMTAGAYFLSCRCCACVAGERLSNQGEIEKARVAMKFILVIYPRIYPKCQSIRIGLVTVPYPARIRPLNVRAHLCNAANR